MTSVALEQSTGIRVIDPLECGGWDRLVSAFASATAFHRQAWARTVQCAYGFRPCFLVSGPLNCPEAILPLMEVRSWITGMRGISLPFTDECQPILHRKENATKLFDSAVALGRQRGWRYVEIRGGDAPTPGAAPSTRYLGHSLSLDTDLGGIWKAIKESARRAITKAEHAGVAIKVSRDADAMRAYYQLHCKTRRKHGLPPQPRRFFEVLQEFMFSGGGTAVLAYMGDRAIAGAVFLWGGNTATFKYGASDHTFQHLRGSNLVMWRAIQLLHEQGAKTLDFGRTSIANIGLRSFKLSWGATERRIDYYRYSIAHESFERALDHSVSRFARVFRLVPTPIARLCGQWLYRHVA